MADVRRLREARRIIDELIAEAEAEFRCPSCGNADDARMEETPDLLAAPDRLTCLACGQSAPRRAWHAVSEEEVVGG